MTPSVTDASSKHKQILHCLEGRFISNSELRVQFMLLGVYMNTLSSGDSRFGNHSRHLSLVRLIVSEVHDPGAPCILVELQLVLCPYARFEILSSL